MNDLRYALRQLRKSPGFTLIAVLTLALGIGANTAIFSVIYAVLLQPLPYPDADKLVVLTETDANQPQISVSFPDYVDWKRDNTIFENIAVSRRESFNLSGLQGRAPEQISGGLVTANFFKVVGLMPQLGRVFTEEEDRVGGPLVAVISDRLWQRLFSRDPNVLGRTMNFGNQPYTIIGVMPPQMFSPRTVEVWFPLTRRTDNPGWQTRDNHPGLFGWARLKEGVTIEKGNVVLIRTGQMRKWPDFDGYLVGSPGLGLAACKWLCEEAGAMCIAGDSIGLEVMPWDEPDAFREMGRGGGLRPGNRCRRSHASCARVQAVAS